jgi:hypothetical protein
MRRSFPATRSINFDEESILNYCLKVHCTKGQVRNALPGIGRRDPGHFGPRLGRPDCKSFQVIFGQIVGWSSLGNTASGARLRVLEMRPLGIEGDRAEKYQPF